MKLSDFDFRVWDNGKYHYPIKVNNDIVDINLTIGINDEIELFTGLYDKKGNKIYEGDIIKYVYIFKHELLDKGMIKRLPKKVSIGYIGIDNFLGFKILKNKELQCFMKDITNIEIIGNIHENKELLEGE
ncbi:YopX family protein [Campylobacter coli]